MEFHAGLAASGPFDGAFQRVDGAERNLDEITDAQFVLAMAQAAALGRELRYIDIARLVVGKLTSACDLHEQPIFLPAIHPVSPSGGTVECSIGSRLKAA
jgi:hypothetical protein